MQFEWYEDVTRSRLKALLELISSKGSSKGAVEEIEDKAV